MHQRFPEILDVNAQHDDATFQAKQAQIRNTAKLLDRFCTSQGLAPSPAKTEEQCSYDTLRNEMYESMLNEYEALDA